MLLQSLPRFVVLAALPCFAAGVEAGSGNDSTVIVGNGAGLEFVLEKEGFRYGFRQKVGEFMVPAHFVSR